MKRTVSSLAILRVNWDSFGKDYIENFVPFIATLITKCDYNEIIVDTISKDFSDEFGLTIPYLPMVTILNRARARGLIKRSKGRYFALKDKALELDFSNIARNMLAKQDKIISLFIEFVKINYKQYLEDLSNEKAETIFISFLKSYDLDILFASQNKSILPDVQPSIKDKFLVNMFIKHSYEHEPEVFNFIVDIAIGYMLANAILYNEHHWFNTKLRGINIYFDTRFILRLLGIEGDKRKDAYVDLLSTIKEQGGKLFLFRHNHDEIMAIFENCLKWINRPNIDFIKAGSALNYFIQEGYKSSGIESFINNINTLLNSHNIAIIDAPHPLKYRKYQIDENDLTSVIVETYKSTNPGFQEKEMDFTIQRDVKSISTIYKLRMGNSPKNIKEAKHLFVTTNHTLAYANRKFELSLPDYTYTLPACLTDIIVGTAIWLQSPAKVSNINKKKLIADCYAALQPSNILVKRLVTESEKLRQAGTVTQEEYYLLRTSRGVRELLAVKTMGDAENFTDRTPEEILEEIQERIRNEEKLKYLQERELHEKTKERLELIEGEKQETIGKIKYIAEIISKIVSYSFFGLGILFLGLVIFDQIISPNYIDNKLVKIVIIALAIIFNFGSLVYGYYLKKIKDKINHWLESKILSYWYRV